MRKILILVTFAFSISANCQISKYNQPLKKTTLEVGEWFLNKSLENYVTKQNPVGYKTSYEELKRVLDYYTLDITEAEIDNSLIDKSVENLHDFKNMSDSLLIEWSQIKMVWRTSDEYQINWTCGNEINLISISKIK